MSRRPVILLVLFGISLMDCHLLRPAAVPKSGAIKITVVNAADTSMALPGVSVSMVCGDGHIETIGQTDQFGQLLVPKERLRTRSAMALLFCHDYFFCGAIRPNEERLLEYDEYLIAIAPIVVR